MPSYYYDGKLKVWAKKCSCCNEITLGVEDVRESIPIFETMYGHAHESAGMADGLSSRCWICNASKRRKLGVTRPIIEAMMKKQDSQCSICCKELSISKDAIISRKAHVDHDESSGMVRELLCGDCNRGIGLFQHDSDALAKAALYCAKYKRQIKCLKIERS